MSESQTENQRKNPTERLGWGTWETKQRTGFFHLPICFTIYDLLDNQTLEEEIQLIDAMATHLNQRYRQEVKQKT